MAKARRQHRASHKPASAADSRGIQAALAALYSTDPVTPERAAAIRQQLESTPYRTRQRELQLSEAADDS